MNTYMIQNTLKLYVEWEPEVCRIARKEPVSTGHFFRKLNLAEESIVYEDLLSGFRLQWCTDMPH